METRGVWTRSAQKKGTVGMASRERKAETCRVMHQVDGIGGEESCSSTHAPLGVIQVIQIRLAIAGILRMPVE